ncbi:MAG TPA: cytochrome c [Gemmatimonadaceae bacterium]|nr:cytochrome c [Gemmatimonadaceae bacterium]
MTRAGILRTALLAVAAGAPAHVRRADHRPGPPAHYALGRPATTEEIRAMDVTVMPDGIGLPAGSGTAVQGAAIFRQRCARCHGPTGVEGPFDRLVGREPRQGFPFGRDASLVRTIGNYWPYATTVYDYINRAMPYDAPGSLKPNEVYALAAFLLWRNEIIADTATIDARTLPRVRMPARDRFVVDNRRGGPEIR